MTSSEQRIGRTCQDRLSVWRFQYLPGVVIGLTLLIFAATILLAGLQLRQKIRQQITSRNGEILQAVALMQQFADDSELDPADSVEDPASQFTSLVKTSPSQGILAARLFDPAGRFVIAYPGYVTEAKLDESDLPALMRLKPVSHFHTGARLASLLKHAAETSPPAGQTAPLLEVLIPIHASYNTALLGVAQLILDGAGIAAEFATLDHDLILQATTAFITGGLIIVTALGWTFRRLQRANALLEGRTADLVRANQELALAAKTSAVGALTAHLIHGLKNPLFGLQTFVAGRGQEPTSGSDTEWRVAVATTRRMQAMINDVLRVLREENDAAAYNLSLAELVELLTTKLKPTASAAGVQFLTRLGAAGELSNRDANLVALILENLIQNAIETNARGKTVKLVIEVRDEQLVFEVHDEGPGFPAELRDTLFRPCQSTRAGGSGIGLAISKQLANHLGAELELKRSSPDGCVFALTLAARPAVKKTALAAQAPS